MSLVTPACGRRGLRAWTRYLVGSVSLRVLREFRVQFLEGFRGFRV